jgi:hypothetical protein
VKAAQKFYVSLAHGEEEIRHTVEALAWRSGRRDRRP